MLSVAAPVTAIILLLVFSRGDEPRPDGTAVRGERESADDISEAQEAELRRLGTLGYISGSVPVPEETGVLRHDPDAVHAGPTLYSCSEGSAAILIDMDGDIIHSWHYPGFKSWRRAHRVGVREPGLRSAGR